MLNRLAPLGSACLAATLGLLLSAGSCVESDVGMPCNLQKNARLDVSRAGCADAGPDDADTRPECFDFSPSLADLEAGPDKEYVSFGAAECDNLTCVRTAGDRVPEQEGQPDGYCSGECITDDDCQGGTDGDYECRELFLDQAFLRSLEQTLSAEEYARYFGRIKNAKFCARIR